MDHESTKDREGAKREGREGEGAGGGTMAAGTMAAAGMVFVKGEGRWYKTGMTAQRPSWQRHLVVLLLYGLLSLVLTYPLVTQFASHVPGDGIDDPALAWNLWWVKFSLVDQQLNPFPSGWMFYPLGINLAFYTLTVLNGLLSVPLQVALGLVPASNLVLLSSYVLSGYGAYLLGLQVLGGAGKAEGGGRNARLIRHSAAFLAGLVYAFSSSKMFYAALGQFNIASSQWVPLAVLYTVRSLRPGARLREPLMAGLFVVLQAYAELTYASFLAVFILLAAGFQLVVGIAGAATEGTPLRGAGMEDTPPHGAGMEDTPPHGAATEGTPLRGVGTAGAAQRIGVGTEGGAATEGTPLRRDGRGAPTQGWAGRLLANLVVMGLVVAVGVAPILANMVPDLRAEGDFLVEGGGFADLFSADLAGYGLPTQLHPVWGGAIEAAVAAAGPGLQGKEWQVNKGQHLTLGYLALLLALLGLWAGRRRAGTWFWALAALFFFLLTLGPTVRWMGQETGIPGPFRLMQMLPFFRGNRYPSRWGVMLLVCVAPLVALGANWVLGKVAGWRPAARWPVPAVALLLGAGLLWESLSIPLPMSDMRVPGIYGVVAEDRAGGAVLDLPLGWRNGFSVFGKQDPIIMASQWWQTEHEKPVLGGNTSRNPEHKFRYFLEAPLIGALTILANADDEHPHVREAMAGGLAALREGDPSLGNDPVLQQAAADAAEALQALNTRYVVVHRDHVPAELVQFVEGYLPVRQIAAEGEHVLYEVDLPGLPAQVTVGLAEDPLSRGEGWSGVGEGSSVAAGGEGPALWAQRRETRAILPPVQPGADRLAVRAAAAGPGQTLALAVNGYRTAAQPLPEAWSEVMFQLPAGVLRDRPNDVTLVFGELYPVEQAGSVAKGETGLLVESAGLEAGNHGHIWLNGRDVSPGGRGYNLATIEAGTGRLVAAASFDTHADLAASAALVEFLRQVEPGQIVAVAVKDTAADQLSPEAAEALGQLGLADMRGRFRWSQAALVMPAAEGAGGGQVIERVSGVEPVAVGWGPGWREPAVAAAVAWLRAEPPAAGGAPGTDQ